MAREYVYDGSTNTIVGNKGIAAYLGICVRTLSRWRKYHGFPAAPLPDGRIMTTKPLIDNWILSRMDVKTARNGGRRVGENGSKPVDSTVDNLLMEESHQSSD